VPIRNPDPFDDLLGKIDPHKNPFVLKLTEAQASGSLPVAFGPLLQSFPGAWRERIRRHNGPAVTSPLVVEIGCHYGHTLTDLALKHRDVFFVGLDITFKRVVTTAQRAQSLGLTNVFVALANAHGLNELFAEGEADGFITFFPDPWQKKKHAHNRLYAPNFCNAAKRAPFKPGVILVHTYHTPHFADACKHMADAGFCKIDDLPILGCDDYSSAFMRRYELQKLPWHGQKWIKGSH